jgi:TusE/DsrC/DsvC family sulfur relay protein
MSKKRKSPKRMKRKAGRMAKKKSAAKPRPKPRPKAKKKRALSKRRITTARTKAEPARQPLRRPATMYSILHPGVELQAEPDFRDSPEGWTRADAQTLAVKMGLKLTEDHWEVIRVLQGCYKDEVSPRLRLLHDALEARFTAKGGMKYLFGIFPHGPIAQGCALAGLKPPIGAREDSAGTVA